MEKKIDLFIKTYRKDFWLLYLALKTIERNVTGYNTLNLLIPEEDKEHFDTRGLPERTLVHYVKDREPGWLMQQVFKMKAYQYCYADYIMFSDSDCFFDHPLNLQDCIKDDKPEILYTAWKDVADAIVWREPTEKFLKEPVEWETMRRNNQIYHRSTLIAISEFQPNVEEIIMSSAKFSEFNTMSSYAMKHEPDRYTFVNTADWTYVPPHGTQVWSHANKDKGASEIHHLEYIRTLETIIKSFGLPLPE